MNILKWKRLKSFDREEKTIIAYMLSSVDLMAMLVPVIVIIWGDNNVTFGEMLVLQGIFTLTLLFAEVPSGALSDSWLGRKWSEVLGNGLLALAMAIYAIANGFLGFAIAESIAGVAIAMKTGNASSLLYDTLIEQDSKPKFNQIVSRVMTLTFIVGSASNIVGGVLGTIHLRLPLAMLAILYGLITCYDIIVVREPQRVRAKTIAHATFKASRSILTKPVLSILCIYTIATGVLSRIVFWAYQPLMINIGHYGPFEIGVVMASLNIVAALGSKAIKILGTRIRNIGILAIFMGVATIGTFGITQATNILTLLLSICLIQVIRGLSRSYYTIVQQEYLESDERSTFNSLDSLKNSLLYAMIAALLKDCSVN
ncbi:MAG: MFS transporter, partial [Candidatus Hodarchaeota archaeon]